MPYIIILKVRKFHQPTVDRFSTAKQNLWVQILWYKLGIHRNDTKVTSENTMEFLFDMDYFGEEALNKGIAAIGDGTLLQLVSDSSADLEDFTRFVLTMSI